MTPNTLVGFIGQGWIGKNYADDFERRGFTVVRYGLEPEFKDNKARLAECSVVFVAVPTPTTQEGFDVSAVREVLKLVGEGRIAVIKSTLLPGTTDILQKEFPQLIILNSPEFLREKNAAYDAANPNRNLVGIPEDSERYTTAAKEVLALLPPAPYTRVLPAASAELAKYAGNVFLAEKVIFANMLSDMASALGVPYEDIQEALAADPRIGPSHLAIMNASGHTEQPGRGAGGHCFIKDLEAFRRLYASLMHDEKGNALLRAQIEKNNALLTASKKDLDLLESVYGSTFEVPE